MLIFILLCFITGFFIINLLCKNVDLSRLLIFSIPIGVVFHTIIFLCLAFINIYYNKYLFILASCLPLLSLVKNKMNIKNDLKDIPLYYLIFLLYIICRLLIMASTGFFEFYNYDEFTAYQTGSTITYLSHDFIEIYQTYAPINYFIGTMSLEFVGLSVTAARIFSVLFFGLTSLFIFKSLRENKVNRHISSLLSMLFLVASSEMLEMAKGFYTNIFFMSYFTMSIYGLIYHYFVKREKNIPYIYYILAIGAFLTRREAMYFVIVVLFLLSIIVFIKKLINIKQLFIMNLPLLFPFLWKIMEKSYHFTFGLNNPESVDPIIEKLTGNNLKSFLSNVYTQMLGPDYYYFNTFICIVFIITILIILAKIVRKKSRNDITIFASIVMVVEFMYIAIILITEIVLFSIGEYLQAASFSRYVVPVLEINFILLGCLLFYNTDTSNSSENCKVFLSKNRKKISKPKILLIIPAYNEEKNILKTVNSINEYNEKNNKNYDYIVINDGSKDETETVLNKYHIQHIELINNLGIGGAVQTGYKYAFNHDYDIAVQFDGDGQHDVNYVEKIIEPIIEGQCDLVIGSRFKDKNCKTFKSSFLRRVGIKLISLAMKVMTNITIYDTTSGFRAANRDVIKEFSKDYPVEYPEPISTVYLLKGGYFVSEIQVNMKERENGESSIRSWKDAYYMINVFLSIIVVGMRGKK